ncbi:MAG TPA: NYN domain-containing protein, partial [Thermoanaerobaculia bacterium]
MGAPPPVGAMNQEEQILALFIDIDNLLIGLRETGHPKFDVKLLISRLLEKGKIVVKRAYADWSRYTEYKRAFHESAFELIDIPQHRMTGKNSADIRMVVDAMDLASNKAHITTFVIGSGDSDFSPLVSKLKENNKQV